MHTIQHLLSEIGTASWQDLTLAVGNIFFCVTLIPMLRRPERPPLLTCIPTGLALLAGGFVFASLHLWLTALTQTITGLQWLALALKRPPGGAPKPTGGGSAIGQKMCVLKTRINMVLRKTRRSQFLTSPTSKRWLVAASPLSPSQVT
jgi:hypothetical protein